MTALQLVDTATGEVLDPRQMFEDFWLLYPKKVAKADARKAWSRIPPREHMAILEAEVLWSKVWAASEWQYLPHPATWLRGERWADELPPEYRQTHASHAAAALPEPAARTVMPDHVRAALAKLRHGK